MDTTLRQRIETGFETFGRMVTRNAWMALILCLTLVAGLASQIPNIVMDTATESFLHDDDPALLDYNEFRDQFGRDELVMVAIEAPDVFAPKFLKKLKTLHYELRDNTPHLDDITSLINARNTFGREDELIVEDLFEQWPTDAAGFAEKRARASANPLLENLLLSEDQKITTIVIRTNAYSAQGGDTIDALEGFDDLDAPSGEAVERTYLTDAENTELSEAVVRIANSYAAPDFIVHVAGSPIVVDDLKKSMQTNMKRFMLMSIVIIALILFAMFRRITGVVLPLLIVITSLLATLGMLPLSGRPFTIPMQILPSFLLAVGVGASVHLLSIFFRHVQQGNGRQDSVVYALGHSGLPIMMTSLTTAAGLASFSGASVAPIADLGVMASFGILLSLVLNLVMLPALLTLLPLKAKSSNGAHARHARMDAILEWIARFSVDRSRVVLSISAVLLALALGGVSQLQFSHLPFTWLPADNPARAATDFVDLRMKGASVVEVVVDTKRVNGLYDPKI
ncbi:MAG: MMPL family transporter, partial [Magnetovibrio sp.]|nr:MMPL family transporter [Magnetovibrio sp.]